MDDDSPGAWRVRASNAASVRMNEERDAIVQAVTDHIDETLPDKIAAGFAAGIREALKDEDVMAAFWKQGYAQLADNATVGVKLWIGGRILYLLLGAAFTAVMAWMATRGVFK